MGAVDRQSAQDDFPKALGADTIWLARFGRQRDWRDQLRKAAQDHKFNATLKPRLDRAVEDWHRSQPPNIPPPVVLDHPLDPELQTGESRLLGGPMSIHAPWSDGAKQDPTD